MRRKTGREEWTCTARWDSSLWTFYTRANEVCTPLSPPSLLRGLSPILLDTVKEWRASSLGSNADHSYSDAESGVWDFLGSKVCLCTLGVEPDVTLSPHRLHKVLLSSSQSLLSKRHNVVWHGFLPLCHAGAKHRGDVLVGLSASCPCPQRTSPVAITYIRKCRWKFKF